VKGKQVSESLTIRRVAAVSSRSTGSHKQGMQQRTDALMVNGNAQRRSTVHRAIDVRQLPVGKRADLRHPVDDVRLHGSSPLDGLEPNGTTQNVRLATHALRSQKLIAAVLVMLNYAAVALFAVILIAQLITGAAS